MQYEDEQLQKWKRNTIKNYPRRKEFSKRQKLKNYSNTC